MNQYQRIYNILIEAQELEEELSKIQKLGIGLAAGGATLFATSRVGGKVSSPTPPRPNIVHQQSPRVGPEVLQRPKASEPSQRAAISSIADKKKKADIDAEATRRQSGINKVGEWKKTIKIRGGGDINKSFTFPHGTGGHTYTRQEMEHMLNVHPTHKDYGRKPTYDKGEFMGYHD